MIAEYEDADRNAVLSGTLPYGLTLQHKHIPEMTAHTGLTQPPIFMPILGEDVYKRQSSSIAMPRKDPPSAASSKACGPRAWSRSRSPPWWPPAPPDGRKPPLRRAWFPCHMDALCRVGGLGPLGRLCGQPSPFPAQGLPGSFPHSAQFKGCRALSPSAPIQGLPDAFPRPAPPAARNLATGSFFAKCRFKCMHMSYGFEISIETKGRLCYDRR